MTHRELPERPTQGEYASLPAFIYFRLRTVAAESRLREAVEALDYIRDNANYNGHAVIWKRADIAMSRIGPLPNEAKP